MDDASVLMERQVKYDYLIQVMDAIRSAEVRGPTASRAADVRPAERRRKRVELFTEHRRGRSPMSLLEPSRSSPREDAELNLIPLIDVMSVLVAFLLIYTADVEIVQNTKGVEIPQSTAETQAAAVGRGDDHAGTTCSCRASWSRTSPTSTRRATPLVEPLRRCSIVRCCWAAAPTRSTAHARSHGDRRQVAAVRAGAKVMATCTRPRTARSRSRCCRKRKPAMHAASPTLLAKT